MRRAGSVGRSSVGRKADEVLGRVSDGVVALDCDWRCVYVNRKAGENRIFPSPDGISIFLHDITDRKRADEELRANTALLEGQNRVLEAIARGAPLGDALDMLLRVIEAQSPGMLSSILLLDADGIHVRHGAAPSLPETFVRAVDGEPIGPAAGSCGTAAYRGEPVFVDHVATDPLWENYRELALTRGLRACWSTPVFDPHQRVQEEFEGTGAGLAIAKKLVDRMGGRIWAESSRGSGATFFVELPQTGRTERGE